MQQTFPAGTAQRVIIEVVDGKLIVHGWDQQTLQLRTEADAPAIQQEGDALLIGHCEDTLELWVPVETAIRARVVEDDARIESVRQVELEQVSGDLLLKDIRGDVKLDGVDGDVDISHIGGSLTITSVVSGDLDVTDVAGVYIIDRIEGEASFTSIPRVEANDIAGDVSLENTNEVTIAHIDGDIDAKGEIAALNCSNVNGDCTIRPEGMTAVALENVNGDLIVEGASQLRVSNIGGDCEVQGNGEFTVGNIGGDVTLVGGTQVRIGHLSGDCNIRDVQGDVELGHLASDVKLTGVGGNVRAGNVGGDANLRGIQGSVALGAVGGDLDLQGTFPAESATRLHVGGDARISLPEGANVTIRATVGGDISGRSIVSSSGGNFVNLVYGEGTAQLELFVGGDLRLDSPQDPQNSSSSGDSFPWDWSGFGKEMSRFGREMGRMGQNLGRDISAAVQQSTASIGADVARDLAKANKDQRRRLRKHQEEQERSARRHEEERRRHVELESRRGHHGGDPYFNVRIHDREWQMDPERIERIIEQARRAAAEGVQGAFEAIEHALNNLRVTMPPVPPVPPTEGTQPPAPPAPPVSPVPPVPPVPPVASVPPVEPDLERPFSEELPLEGPDLEEPFSEAPVQAQPVAKQPANRPAHRNIEQEREAILRMIAEGRISPEEGDLLLEALDS